MKIKDGAIVGILVLPLFAASATGPLIGTSIGIVLAMLAGWLAIYPIRQRR
jgi:hypothetical protein